jgi:hypothetical protein
VLHRFNGDEIYAVKSATLEASEEDGAVELFLYVDTRAKRIQTLPDTAELDPRPNAEVYITLKKLDVSRLVGRRFSVPTSWSEATGDHVSCIYYCDHNDLNNFAVSARRPERKALSYNNYGYPSRPGEASHGTPLSGPLG